MAREFPDKVSICMPAGTTIKDEALAYFNFLADHPGSRKLPAWQAIVQAFKSEWPCNERNTRDSDDDAPIRLVQRWDYLNVDCRGGDAKDAAVTDKACDERLVVEKELKRLGCTVDRDAWSCGKKEH
jgi:Rap1a immunity proteins